MSGKYINFIVGNKGSGKSLYEAVNALRLLRGYRRLEKKYKTMPRRVYFSKQKFAPKIENKELILSPRTIDHFRRNLSPEEYEKTIASIKTTEQLVSFNRDRHLDYWDNVDQLHYCPRMYCWKGSKPHHIHNTDIGWDEIGNDIPPDNWKNNPDWLRQIFSHARKRQNRIFANAQRYEMVDIHFRRQVDVAYVVNKLIGTRDINASRPDPKWVFVLQIVREFDPEQIEVEGDPRHLDTSWFFKGLYWYSKKDTDIFDTTFELPPYQVTKMKEVVLQCIEGENCKDPKHREKVKHVIV